MKDLNIGAGFVGLLAMVLGGSSGCSADPSNNPSQAPMPELTVSSIQTRVIEGMRCEITGLLTNSGSVPVQDAEFRLVQHYESRVEILASLPLDRRAVGESRPFRLPYPCDALVGLRAFRAYSNELPLRVIER